MAWWLHFVGYYFFRRVGLALGLAPRDREVGRLPVFAAFAAAALGAAAGAAPCCCCAHSPAAATTHTAATPLASPSPLGSAGSSRSGQGVSG